MRGRRLLLLWKLIPEFPDGHELAVLREFLVFEMPHVDGLGQDDVLLVPERAALAPRSLPANGWGRGCLLYTSPSPRD
eukprot:15448891-Alexandrium_andersonii.AAC.1